MDKLIILAPGDLSPRLQSMVDFATEGYRTTTIKEVDALPELRDKRLLFAVELGATGINLGLFQILHHLMASPDCMKNSVASILINSENELFSRQIARKIILYANLAGCTFPGRPICEATGSLKNFTGKQKKLPHLSLEQACLQDAKEVVQRLMAFEYTPLQTPRVLVLHASNHKTSNTLFLWSLVKKHLAEYDIQEIHIENGSVVDCKGCPYKACKHYSQNDTCFYGGVMVEEVYPAIAACDVLIMLCPNYNDAISATISATVNRLTSLFRKVKFYDKYLYAIIVSGFSGSDIIGEQLISSFNINKTFVLPPKFALMETANEIGEMGRILGIEEKARIFAEGIKANIKGASGRKATNA